MSGLKWRDGKDVTFYWQYEAAPVVDVTPYIIVDNQRISPVGWFPQPGSAAAEREDRKSGPSVLLTESRFQGRPGKNPGGARSTVGMI